MAQRFTDHSRLSRYSTLATAPVVGLLVALCGAGCGPSNNAAGGGAAPSGGAPATGSAAKGAPAIAGFKVALVASGSRTDGGWNAGAFKGLDSVKKELGLPDADVASVDDQKSAGEQEESLRAFATKKFNVVFGHGQEYEEIALKIEKDFPGTVFVISSGAKIGKNTTPIVLQLEDGAYLEGMLAAGMSISGKLAEVGAQKIPPVQSVFTAFEKGARAVNPKITILPPVYTDDWEDANKAKQATITLVDQGADVVMQDLDSAAHGVFDAVQEANKRGKTVYALGTNNDQNAMAPDVVLASAPIYIDKAFVTIAKGVRDGTFKPSDKPWDMKSGAIGFVLNPQLEAKIPAHLKTEIEYARTKVIDGTVKTK